MAKLPARHPRFLHRPLAWLADWAVLTVVASLWYAWAVPWLRSHEQEVPWPLSEGLPAALRLAPVAFALALVLARELGPWRRGLGMALMRLGVEDAQGGVPRRSRMLGRRLASLLAWATGGLGFLPALVGHRLALHDRLSGTRVVRRGPPRPWLALLLIASGPLSVWGSVRWVQWEPPRQVWRWGYLDRSGQVVIEPRFRAVTPFQDRLALVRQGGSWYWLDGEGHRLARLGGFETYVSHRQGVAIFQDQRILTTCLDLSGKQLAQAPGEVFPPLEAGLPYGFQDLHGAAWFRRPDGSALTAQVYEEVWPFLEGLGRFKVGGRMGALDAEGHTVVPPAFDDLGPFHQGRAAARLGGSWGLVDRQGRWVVEPSFQDLGGPDREGPALLPAKRDNRWGYLQADGGWAIPQRFDLAKGFTKGGWARVKVGERWGVIDTQGHWALEPHYEEVAPPREAPFAFRQGLRWGYLAPGGRVVVAPVFTVAGGFHGGSAFAKGLNRWFRVAASGRVEPLPQGWILDEEHPALEDERIPFARRQRAEP
jgi:hypothetical protein